MTLRKELNPHVSLPDSDDPKALPSRSGEIIQWSESRLAIKDWMDRNTPLLTDLYEAAVRLIFDQNFPSRLNLIGHCVREIGNSLPHQLEGMTIKRKQVQYKNICDDLLKGWQTAGLSLGGSINTSSAGAASDPNISVPTNIYQKIVSLLDAHQAGTIRPKKAAKQFFEFLAPENAPYDESIQPLIKHWIEIIEWFMEKTHRAEKSINVPEEELLFRFEQFEQVIFSLIGEFFKTTEGLDEILEKANS